MSDVPDAEVSTSAPRSRGESRRTPRGKGSSVADSDVTQPLTCLQNFKAENLKVENLEAEGFRSENEERGRTPKDPAALR